MFFAYIYDNEVKNRKKNFAKKCYFLAMFGQKEIEKKKLKFFFKSDSYKQNVGTKPFQKCVFLSFVNI